MNLDAESLNDVRDVSPLGDAESVRRIFEAKFPGVTTGLFVNREEYSLEVTLANDPVGSAHLALRSGRLGQHHLATSLLSVLINFVVTFSVWLSPCQIILGWLLESAEIAKWTTGLEKGEGPFGVDHVPPYRAAVGQSWSPAPSVEIT
ncbi:hypothetical protein WT98_17050 [Burkholderia territorii]|nr:hypothetical protein WT98_17050 [Burkholderia territorii]